MTKTTTDADFFDLPPTLRAERHGAVAVLKLARPEKRNALDDGTVAGIEAFFTDWADRFPAIVAAAHRIKAASFLIDGEVVIVRDYGTPDFHACCLKSALAPAQFLLVCVVSIGPDDVAASNAQRQGPCRFGVRKRDMPFPYF